MRKLEMTQYQYDHLLGLVLWWSLAAQHEAYRSPKAMLVISRRSGYSALRSCTRTWLPVSTALNILSFFSARSTRPRLFPLHVFYSPVYDTYFRPRRRPLFVVCKDHHFHHPTYLEEYRLVTCLASVWVRAYQPGWMLPNHRWTVLHRPKQYFTGDYRSSRVIASQWCDDWVSSPAEGRILRSLAHFRHVQHLPARLWRTADEASRLVYLRLYFHVCW